MNSYTAAPDWDFVTSDTHFGHRNVIMFDDRPFDDVDHMNWEMVARWNTVVDSCHTVIHLGDLAMGSILDTLKLTTRLNGIRYLVPGNHDRVSSVNQRGRNIERFRSAYEDAGWTILDEQVSTTLAAAPAVMSHYPFAGDSHDKGREGADRYAAVRPVDEGQLLVHGHVHNAWATKRRQYNAGVTMHGYTPVSRMVVEEWARTVGGTDPKLRGSAARHDFDHTGPDSAHRA